MVQMDFLAVNRVRIVRLCKSVKNAKAHRVDIFAIAQLSCLNCVIGLSLSLGLSRFDFASLSMDYYNVFIAY